MYVCSHNLLLELHVVIHMSELHNNSLKILIHLLPDLFNRRLDVGVYNVC
jgi:hypothetical protein